ncbi:MAG: hypothetical protein Q4C44_02320 [bacterium]|nr:hypothetical protein [bacterium]
MNPIETNNNKMAYLIMLLATSLIAVIGGTYAFFTAGISQGETEATLKVGAGQLKIKFANTNSVQITENVQPTPAKNECTKQTGAYYCNQSEYTPVGTKTFTLTGTNTTDASKNMKMPYNIKLVIPQNQFSSGALKYTLIGSKEDSDNGKVVDIRAWQDIPTGANTTGTILGSGYFMPGENVVHTYTFNIYFPDNHISQDTDKNKIFGAKIEITTDEIEEDTTIAAPNNWYSASGDTILGAIKRDNVVSEPLTVPGTTSSAETEAVLASTNDDYGTSYYFRGAVENNYVEYANMCWRIVHITGDGSIKLVLYNYNGLTDSNNTPASNTPCNVTGNNLAFARYTGNTYLSKFNDNNNDNAYIGFMYGTPNSSTYAATHANTNPSTILTNLNKWYTNVLSKQSDFNDTQLADTIWCNNKGVVSNSGFDPLNLSVETNFGYGDNTNYYNTVSNLLYTEELDFTCVDGSNGKLSKFTVSDTVYGNGALNGYGKIGLLTMEEVTFAGGLALNSSSYHYLNQNATSDGWMALSPILYLTNATPDLPAGALVLGSFGNTYLYPVSVTDDKGIRPAISLNSSVTISSGAGTANSPYKIVS